VFWWLYLSIYPISRFLFRWMEWSNYNSDILYVYFMLASIKSMYTKWRLLPLNYHKYHASPHWCDRHPRFVRSTWIFYLWITHLTPDLFRHRIWSVLSDLLVRLPIIVMHYNAMQCNASWQCNDPWSDPLSLSAQFWWVPCRFKFRLISWNFRFMSYHILTHHQHKT